MAIRYDIQLNNNDAVLQNGDIVIGESDTQHVTDTINAFAGWWKETPTQGVGIIRYLKMKGSGQELARNIKIQLTVDGYNSRPLVQFDSSGQLNLDPNVSI